MAHRSQAWRFLSTAVLAAAVHLVTAVPAAAQCVMCYLSAAGSGDRGIRTLQIGIVILMIPTVAILSGLGWMVVRRRNSHLSAETDGCEMDSKWEEELASLQVSPPETESLSPRA
jgi:hypothetical protein